MTDSVPADAPRIAGIRFEQRLGSAGPAPVWLGVDGLGRKVAVKVLQAIAGRPGAALERARLEREARALAELQQAHIVRLWDYRPSPVPCLILEYVAGETLADRLEQARRSGRVGLDPEELLPILKPILEAISTCHLNGIWHRNLTSRAIRLEQGTQRAVLTGFGLAKRDAVDGADTVERLTPTGELPARIDCLAPEQLSGDHRFGMAGPGSDIWGFGTILFECLTGESPYRGGRPTAEHVQSVLTTEPRRLKSLRPELPDWLDLLCAAALQRDARRRLSARELLEQLEAGGSGRSAPDHGGAPSLIHSRGVVMTLVLLMLATAVGLPLIVHARRDAALELRRARLGGRLNTLEKAIARLEPALIEPGLPKAPPDIPDLTEELRAVAPEQLSRFEELRGRAAALELVRLVRGSNGRAVDETLDRVRLWLGGTDDGRQAADLCQALALSRGRLEENTEVLASDAITALHRARNRRDSSGSLRAWLNPGRGDYDLALARLLARRGREQDALAELESAARVGFSDPILEIQLLLGRGRIKDAAEKVRPELDAGRLRPLERRALVRRFDQELTDRRLPEALAIAERFLGCPETHPAARELYRRLAEFAAAEFTRQTRRRSLLDNSIPAVSPQGMKALADAITRILPPAHRNAHRNKALIEGLHDYVVVVTTQAEGRGVHAIEMAEVLTELCPDSEQMILAWSGAALRVANNRDERNDSVLDRVISRFASLQGRIKTTVTRLQVELNMMRLLLARGRERTIFELFDEPSLEERRLRPALAARCVVLRAQARMHSQPPDPGDALRLLDAAFEISPDARYDSGAWVLLCRALRTRGDLERLGTEAEAMARKLAGTRAEASDWSGLLSQLLFVPPTKISALLEPVRRVVAERVEAKELPRAVFSESFRKILSMAERLAVGGQVRVEEFESLERRSSTAQDKRLISEARKPGPAGARIVALMRIFQFTIRAQ